MFNRLVLTPNAYFYRVLKPISKTAIIKMQAAAAVNKCGNFIYKTIRHSFKVGALDFELSLVVFKQEMLPPFLTAGAEKELRYCYLLLVEYAQFLIISKTGASECTTVIEGKIESLSYQEISEFKITATTKIEKLSVSNLDTALGAMRRSAFEANDVKDTLSTIGMGNKIVTVLKIKNQAKHSTIAPGTSRINDQSRREDLAQFCFWVAEQCKSLSKFTPKPCYLDNFAEPLEFKKHIGKLKVVSVLFNFSAILEGLNDESVIGIDYLDSNGKSRDINLRLLSETNDLCLDIVYVKKSKRHWIQNSIDNSLELKILKNGFRIHSTKLDRIRVHYTTGEIYPLDWLINKQNLFIIGFDAADIRYAQKTLFRDSRLLRNLPHFLKAFETDVVFNMISSEKGNCVAASKSFDSGCLFETIESKFACDCDYLFCDDLGDEWADYIGFGKDKFIRFYHAKYSPKGFSASAFHDLVSQALKNIGNFNFDQNLNIKSKKVSDLYSGTKISRLRIGKNATSCVKDLHSTYNNPKTLKEIVLVINFLSKRELDSQLSLLAGGKAKNQTVQILWLLSSLFGTCLDKGIRVRILTKP
ncbi:MAG: hypothetical protein ABIN94_22245 [Ferruginibacter sp.]